MGKDRSGRATGVASRFGRRAVLLGAVVSGLLFPAGALATTTITDSPTSPTKDNQPSFSFTSDDGTTFECRIDSVEEADFESCTSPHTTAVLPDGPHKFEVRDPDATTPSTDSRSFVVDTTAPVTEITGGPEGPTRNNEPRFTFSATDATATTFLCRVYEPPADPLFAPCSGTGSHATDPLPDGEYVFEVFATDAAGNFETPPKARNFTVDTADPNTQIDSGPPGVTRDDTPTFGFSSPDEPGSTFECRIDDADFAPCSSEYTTAALPDGPHNFVVQAVDAAGNRDENPASRNFIVDTIPPDTKIDSGPVGTVSDATPTFTFSSGDGVRFECRMDSNDETDFAPCSSPYTPAGPLTNGNHVFNVRAFDAAGNVDSSPATQTFEVDTSKPPDTTPPDTTLKKQPKSRIKTKKKKARIEVAFKSEPGAAFRCKLDKAKYEPCTSPYSVKARSKPGKGKKHEISVRAIDSAGNVGDPVVVGFRVVRKLRLKESVAERTVATALQRHGFAKRVVRAVRVNCSRRAYSAFSCKFSSNFPGYRLTGRGEVKLRAHLSYRFRVKAQGVRLTLTDRNESG